ncbi:Putative 6-phosphogluconate dehydrogenase [Candidatus Hydrogenisulfobacillus filiaventi]|uniref:6-phosphogluconate dehydrogenase n=1 Tax=Candidatus Hydrogenisulfobacillus filiaventi TaxID=2707344 RepID=A0A6F8ZFV2_9FIRM|nr:decarboxylating 6-phosphogluconate dehydrogenase [Bacillota bacterium]CAB1128628.1 Putative 6-phosphogluconate dehydrogenase [Candidatus Hydrogenisulfobacillus filiaventi]
MELGLVGLGRMGGNMAERLLERGHRIVGYARSAANRKHLSDLGGEAAASLEDLVAALHPPRAVWVMVPAGAATEEVINTLAGLLTPGDTIVDGGNSNYRDSLRRAAALAERQLHFVDAGTSGGIWGLQEGYCLMVGGPQEAVARLEPVFRDLAPEGGYLHVGPTGAGHFVKMVHNGIEYGLLQAYGEGFEILKESRFNLDLGAIARLWLHGSVVRSWLLELLSDVYESNPDLQGIAGYVEDSGEGRWTVAEALEENVPAPVITLSLLARLASRQPESYSAKVIAALRHEFGGHAIKGE